jgi:elongation factor G
MRQKLIEASCEVSEEMMEKYFAEEPLTEEELLNGLKEGIKEQNFIPILCAAGDKQIGVLPIADFIINIMPTPDHFKQVKGIIKDGGEVITRKIEENEKFSAFVFKTTVDPFAGRTSFLKIHSGKIRVGDEILNVQKDEKIKIGHIYILKGKNRDEISEASAGDIVVLAKLENTLTSDSLSDTSHTIKFPSLKIPSPIAFTAVTSDNKKDMEKISNALYKIIEEDPSFVVKYNKETKETVIENNGQLQTEIALKKIEAKNNLKIVRSVPKVAYRETIKKKTPGHYRHKKQSGGHGQFGEVFIEVSPKQRGEGFEFENNIVGGAIPKNFIPAVEKGVIEAMEYGVLAGYPVMDIKVTLYDGKYHDVDSSEMAFKIAGRGAMKEAMQQASPVLLEPIMKAKIYAPDEYTGGIMSDLNSKRARVSGSSLGTDGLTEIEALVPLSEMLKYSIDLKGITSGEGTFEMEFSHYEELQGRDAEMVIKAAELQKAEENN